MAASVPLELTEKEWFVQAPWGRICVVAWGNSLDPPVLMIHGAMDSAASFRPLIKLLPSNFYYVAMELPGNGRSDRLPPGLMLSIYDFVYCIDFISRHFGWTSFDYIAHSMSVAIGRHFNICYPGRINRVVELDPAQLEVPLKLCVPPVRFAEWYHKNFTSYFKKYAKFNAPKETAPKLTKEQALKRIKQIRKLTDPTALATLERFSEPCGKGLIRLTHDQRYKLIQYPPLDAFQLKNLFTSISNPTLIITAAGSESIRNNPDTKFILDENEYPDRNVRIKHVRGSHDVHIIHPERMAPYVSQFLLHGLKGLDSSAKL